MVFGHYNYRVNPEHQFLLMGSTSKQATTEKDITKVADDLLLFKKYPNTLIEDVVIKSVKVLMNDVVEMPSLEEAKKEINGAIKVTEVFFKYRTDLRSHHHLSSNILWLEQQERIINYIFQLRELVKDHSQLNAILKDENFIDFLDRFSTFYGRDNKLNDSSLLGLALLWNSPKGSAYLTSFLEHVKKGRGVSLKLLALGKFTFLSKHHIELSQRYGELVGFMMGNLSDLESKALKTVLDEIYHNRATVTNTQVHQDSLLMAFNTDSDDPKSIRFRKKLASHQTLYAQSLQDLQDSLERADSELGKRKIADEIRAFKKFENYCPRPTGIMYEMAQWIPKIGLKAPTSTEGSSSSTTTEPPVATFDPIGPVERIIGFATPKGVKRESRIRLDVSKALGPDNLDLNKKERLILGMLLCACDDVATQDNMSEPQKWPYSQELNEILTQFKQEECPHLERLSDEQQKALVAEGIRFAREVNYRLADNLLNLT